MFGPHIVNDKFQEAVNLLSHRGPDDSGVLIADGVALGHTRLSIIDLSSKGKQPMCFDNLAIVYNGEVFNYQEIRRQLEKSGYDFISDTDTEVVLKAFHCWGVRAVEQFIGMFAFAVYNFSSREVFIFRDRVGVKPLYYYLDNNYFAFSSELRSLVKIFGPFEIDKSSLFDYFKYGYISSGNSIFKNCKKLHPGHYIHKRSDSFVQCRYWDLRDSFEKGEFSCSEDNLVDQLEDLLVSSCRYRMISDVPVGVFLSGGIDSSLVAAIIQNKIGGTHTFTIGFEENKYDESVCARKIASHIGAIHHESILTSGVAKNHISKIVDMYDEPFADSSAIPTSLVSQFACGNGVKVVISADGGDEIFCGYSRYWLAHRIGNYILRTPKDVRKFISYLMGKLGVDRFSKFIHMHNIDHKYNQFRCMLTSDSWSSLYARLTSNMDDREVCCLLGDYEDRCSDQLLFDNVINPMQGMMITDFNRYLPDDILVKVDRATMFHSVEGREPLLDHRIVEFASRLPFNMKYRNGMSKYILRKVLERYVPENIFNRPKQGFAIPIFEWFSGSLFYLFEEYLSRERIEAEGILDFEYVSNQLYRLRNRMPVNINRLWFILVFEMWYEKWVEG